MLMVQEHNYNICCSLHIWVRVFVNFDIRIGDICGKFHWSWVVYDSHFRYFHWHFWAYKYLQGYFEQLPKANNFVNPRRRLYFGVQRFIPQHIFACDLRRWASWGRLWINRGLRFSVVHKWSNQRQYGSILSGSILLRYRLHRLHGNDVPEHRGRYNDGCICRS